MIFSIKFSLDLTSYHQERNKTNHRKLFSVKEHNFQISFAFVLKHLTSLANITLFVHQEDKGLFFIIEIIFLLSFPQDIFTSTVRTKFPNRQHFPNGQCYAELGNTTFWNSSEFSNLNGFSFVVSLIVLWECFPLHHLSFISFKNFWPCEMKFDCVVSI